MLFWSRSRPRPQTRLLPRGGHGDAEELGAVNGGLDEAVGAGIVDETVDDGQALNVALGDHDGLLDIQEVVG